MTRESWASRFGFIFATVGFSVGLGNIWRFPYLLGENGGAAFLVVYLILALFIGIPLFTAEICFGRSTQATPIQGMQKLTGTDGSLWNLIGWFGVGAAFLILSYYQVIMSWVLSYLGRFLTGGFSETAPSASSNVFSGVVANPVEVLVMTGVVSVVLGVIVSRGLEKGVERTAKLLVPFLFILLAALTAYSVLMPGAARGVEWLLSPDFSELTPSVVLAALGQVFFSVGVGMAAAFTYGSYLHPEKSDVPGNAAIIVAADTLAALLAGFVMFPALFAVGIEPDVGPGLVFVSMLSVFTSIPWGQFIGGAFFFLVTLAGITSGMALVEALTATVMESYGFRRKQSVWGILICAYVVGVPSALAFGPWSSIEIFGRDLFGLVDFVSGSILLTVGGLLIALYTAYKWGFELFREEANRGAGRLRVTGHWRPVVVIVVPVAVALVLMSGLGLLG